MSLKSLMTHVHDHKPRLRLTIITLEGSLWNVLHKHNIQCVRRSDSDSQSVAHELICFVVFLFYFWTKKE